MEEAICQLPLYSQTGYLLKSYARENTEPDFHPEGWRGHVESNLSNAGIDLHFMRRLAERLPDAYQHKALFFDLCQTHRACRSETISAGGLGRTLYEGALKAFLPGVSASCQANDFSTRCEEHFEKVLEEIPDWRHFFDLFYRLLRASLKGLGKTDRCAEHFQAIMDQPGILLNGVLAKIRADLEAGRRPGQGRPFNPSELLREKPDPGEAVDPPAPWLWPPDVLALAVWVHHAGIGEECRILDVPKNLDRAEEALSDYGLDVELLARLAQWLPSSDVSGKDLLELCRKTTPKTGRKKQGAAKGKISPRGRKVSK